MNIVQEIESLAFSASAITSDAALAQYSGNKAARARVKRDIRALASRYKAFYRRLIAEEKEQHNGNDREGKIPEIPLVAFGNQAPKQEKSSPKNSRKKMGQKSD